MNGDGYGDLLVGAAGEDEKQGRAYLYFGGPHGPARPVSLAPGVNVASNHGRVYVYLGGPAGLPVAPMTRIEGPGTYAFGSQAASAGDVNGDGYSDLALGAFGDGHTASVMGNAFVYRGGVAAKPAVRLDGPDGAGGFFGVVASSPGDVNGDGFDDLVVAAYEALGATGRVYVFPGAKGGVAAAPATTLTGPPAGNFGATLASRGHVATSRRARLRSIAAGSPG